MKTIYTIILASGLYTDGQTTTSTPLPMAPTDCITLSELRLDGAECIKIQWPYGATAPVRPLMDATE